MGTPRPVDGCHGEGKASNTLLSTVDVQETTPHQSTSVESTPVTEVKGPMDDEIGAEKGVGNRGDTELSGPKYPSGISGHGPCMEMGDGALTPGDAPVDTEASRVQDESLLSHTVASSPRSKQDKADHETKEGVDEAIRSKRHRDTSKQREGGEQGRHVEVKQQGRSKEVVDTMRGGSSRKRGRDGDRLKGDSSDKRQFQTKREHIRESAGDIDDGVGAKQGARSCDKGSVRPKEVQTKEGREKARDDAAAAAVRVKGEGRRVKGGGEEGLPVREVTKTKDMAERAKVIAVETKKSGVNAQEAKHSKNIVEVSKVIVNDDGPEVKWKRSVVILKETSTLKDGGVRETGVTHDRNHIIKDVHRANSKEKKKSKAKDGHRAIDGVGGSAALSHSKDLPSHHHRRHSRLDGRRTEVAYVVNEHEERTKMAELVLHEGSQKTESELFGDHTTTGKGTDQMARRPSEDDAIELHVVGTIDADLSENEPVCLTDSSQKLSSLVVRCPGDKTHKHKHKEKKKKRKKCASRSDKSRHR